MPVQSNRARLLPKTSVFSLLTVLMSVTILSNLFRIAASFDRPVFATLGNGTLTVETVKNQSSDRPLTLTNY
jgi:hypothetical protein